MVEDNIKSNQLKPNGSHKFVRNSCYCLFSLGCCRICFAIYGSEDRKILLLLVNISKKITILKQYIFFLKKTGHTKNKTCYYDSSRFS